MSINRNEVVHLVTVPKSLVLLRGQIKYLGENGYNIAIMSSDGIQLENFTETEQKYPINMEREINLSKDLTSLVQVFKTFNSNKPLIVNSGTPKAGLLGTVGSFLARVPIRIYTMRGLKLQTAKGLKFYILWVMEKLCCMLSTDVICISNSIREEIISLKLASPRKIVVLGRGSSNGIKIEDFPEKFNKEKLEIPKFSYEKFTIGYIGRIVKDKGIDDVIEIYNALKKQGYDFQLLLIGSIEQGDPISKQSYETIMTEENIIYISHVENPSKYYYLIDLFLFLTAREGFGNVSIESQAAKTPVITYNVTGAKDTVLNNETGFIIDKGDINKVIEKVIYLYKNENIRKKYGESGRKFVFNNFKNEVIWNELDQFYQKRIKEVN